MTTYGQNVLRQMSSDGIRKGKARYEEQLSQGPTRLVWLEHSKKARGWLVCAGVEDVGRGQLSGKAVARNVLF